MPTDTTASTSLWLEPQGASRDRFTGLIRKLANELGTPVFDPHVTLLGGLSQPESEVVDRSLALAALVPPIEVRLTRAGVGLEYYHFLYFEVAVTEQLREAHATARRAFDLPEEEFEPHLSLAYAIPLEHEPSELLRRVPGRPWGRFMVDSLTLVRTAGAPEEWEVLGRLPLRGTEAQ